MTYRYWNSSEVTVTHLPTATTVSCSSERSQHRNKAKALRCLISKLYAIFGTIPKQEDFVYSSVEPLEEAVAMTEPNNQEESCTHTDITDETN